MSITISGSVDGNGMGKGCIEDNKKTKDSKSPNSSRINEIEAFSNNVTGKRGFHRILGNKKKETF